MTQLLMPVTNPEGGLENRRGNEQRYRPGSETQDETADGANAAGHCHQMMFHRLLSSSLVNGGPLP